MNQQMTWLRLGLAVCALAVLAGCHREAANRFQGYVEGEYVYVASPFAGQLETLSVKRGDWPKPGDPLFALECGLETAARDEADRKLVQGRDTLEDAKKGRRPTELDSAESQLKQARAALVMSEKEFKRQTDLYHRGVSSADDFDRAHSTRDQDDHHVRQLEARPGHGPPRLARRPDRRRGSQCARAGSRARAGRLEPDAKAPELSAERARLRPSLSTRRMGSRGQTGRRAPAARERESPRICSGRQSRFDST